VREHGCSVRMGPLLNVALAYGLASLFHHVHNAEFLETYPNLPTWLSRGWVYAAWCGVTSIGVGGLILLRWRNELAGLFVLGIYAGFGLDGLGHYAVAPLSAHTLTANVSIWLEVTAALALLTAVATSILRVLKLKS
jgi:hypothetical protein